MKISAWTLVPLLLLVALTGCRQQAQTTAKDVTIDLRVDPEAPAVGDATLVVTVTGADNQPINDATVTARGDMSHAGMVPVIETADKGTDGEYMIPFQWTMAGDWTVEVTVELTNGEKASKTFDYTVSGDAMNMGDMTMQATDATDMGDMTMEPTGTMDMNSTDMATPTQEFADQDAG